MSNDSNGGTGDVFVFDRVAGTIALASRNTGTGSGNGTSAAAVISGNGAFIAFQSSGQQPGDQR